MRAVSIAVLLLASTCLTGPAMAADVSVPSPDFQEAPPSAGPANDWSGVYLGILLGYSFGQTDLDPG